MKWNVDNGNLEYNTNYLLIQTLNWIKVHFVKNRNEKESRNNKQAFFGGKSSKNLIVANIFILEIKNGKNEVFTIGCFLTFYTFSGRGGCNKFIWINVYLKCRDFYNKFR
jgi:hypothetical protein